MFMTIETAHEGGATAPVIPTNDAQAAAIEAAKTTPPETEAPPPESKPDEEEKKRNRTRDYINRQNREIGELRAQLKMQQQQQAAPPQTTQIQPAATDKPTLASSGYDVEKYAEAVADWKIAKALEKAEQAGRTRQEQNTQQTTWQAYETKAATFAAEHPDFLEVVGSIRYPISDAMQAAIASHPNGPAIAYHLGHNDDDSFTLAAVENPRLIAAAVERIASRLTAAPQEQQTKPITQAPPPPPRVSGRSPTEVPPEKMTDDEWYAKQKAARTKRA